MEKKFNTGHLLTLIGMAIGFTITCIKVSYASGADAIRMVQLEKDVAVLRVAVSSHDGQLAELKSDFNKAAFGFGRDLKELRESATRQEQAASKQNEIVEAIRNEQIKLSDALRVPKK